MLNLTLIRARALAAGMLLGTAGMYAPPAMAELYKWVDENGVVQFSDRKPRDKGARNVEKQALRDTAPTPAAPPAPEQVEAPAEQTPSADEQLAERNRIRAANCAQSQDNLKILQSGYRIQDSSSGEYLDGAARDARLLQTQEDVAENC